MASFRNRLTFQCKSVDTKILLDIVKTHMSNNTIFHRIIKVKSQSLCKIIEGHAASLYEIKSV